MVRFLKYGITTGASAAAAAKAALVALTDKCTERVVIPTPIGLRLEVPVKFCSKIDSETAVASVFKDAGDDVDVTDGIEITVTVKLTDTGKIKIRGGIGVGTVSKLGLQVQVGEPAINPFPRKMIIEAIKEVLPVGKGAEITIIVPEGKRIAEKTLNPKLGIIGGISILGTTGIVKPLSLESCRRSLVQQIDISIAQGYSRVYFVPGNIGEQITKQLFKAPDLQIVQTGDFVGYMLQKAVDKGLKEIFLVGHSGKMVKLAAGIFNTHHKIGDARKEVIAAYAASVGADTKLVNNLLNSNTTDEATELLRKADILRPTYDKIAQRISSLIIERTKNKIKVSVIIVSMDGKILGLDENACMRGLLNLG